MIKWLKNLSDTWQTAIFGAAVVIAIAIIGGFIKLYLRIKDRTPPKPTDIDTTPPPPPDGIIHNLPYGTIGELLKGRYIPVNNQDNCLWNISSIMLILYQPLMG